MMIRELISIAKELLTRKPTVPVHIGAGIIDALLFISHPNFAIALFLGFGLFELWQSIMTFISLARKKITYNPRDDEGYLDFWDFLFGAFIGAIILLILN